MLNSLLEKLEINLLSQKWSLIQRLIKIIIYRVCPISKNDLIYIFISSNGYCCYVNPLFSRYIR